MKTKLTHPVFSNKIQNLTVTNKTQPDFFKQNSPLADPYPITEQAPIKQPANEEEWFASDKEAYEGQLAVDVFQDKKNIFIKAAIAGVKPEDIEVDLNNDMVTIKGKRSFSQEIKEEDYYIKECYWGGFSRSIILPVDIVNDSVRATVDNGLLTIVLPKSKRPRNTKIQVEKID